MGEKGIFLEYRVDFSFIGGQLGNFLPVKQHLALICLQKAAQNTQKRCFPAAGRAEERHKFIFVNIKVNSLQNDLAVLIALDDIFELNQLFLHFISSLYSILKTKAAWKPKAPLRLFSSRFSDNGGFCPKDRRFRPYGRYAFPPRP